MRLRMIHKLSAKTNKTKYKQQRIVCRSYHFVYNFFGKRGKFKLEF